MLAHLTVSTLFQFANCYLPGNKSKDAEMFFFIAFHPEFVVRHQHGLIPLFAGDGFLLVVVLPKQSYVLGYLLGYFLFVRQHFLFDFWRE